MTIRDRSCWISFPRVSLGGLQGKRTRSEDSWTPSCPDLYLGAHFLTSECWQKFIRGLEKPKNRVSIRERSDKGSAPHSSTPGREGVQCTLIRLTRPSPSGHSKFCPFSSHSLNCQSLLTDSTVPHPTLSKKGETLGRQECAPLQDRDPLPKKHKSCSRQWSRKWAIPYARRLQNEGKGEQPTSCRILSLHRNQLWVSETLFKITLASGFRWDLERESWRVPPVHPFFICQQSLSNSLAARRAARTAWKGSSSPGDSRGGGARGVLASDQRKVVRTLGRRKGSGDRARESAEARQGGGGGGGLLTWISKW